MPKTLLCLVLFLLSSAAAAQTKSPVVQFGEEHSLESKALGEKRTYWVYTPPYYQAKVDQSRQVFPVVFVLDAEWNFSWAAQVVQFMSDSSQIPELIVVGVPNTERQRDLEPTPKTDADSSGPPPFEEFMSEELMPAIDAKYRTGSCHILVGHSMGGALAADAFLRQTGGFQAFIAIDPSLWWNDKNLVRRAEAFEPLANSHASLFIAMADWSQNLDAKNEMIGPSEHFASALQARRSAGVRIGYKHLKSEDHSSSRLPGIYDGLRFVFDSYKPADILALDTPDLINSHYAKLSGRLGFSVLPPEQLVNKIGYFLLQQHQPAKAVACFKLNIGNYPASAYAYSHLAEALVANGEKESAIKNYEKALELDPNVDGAKEDLENLKP